MEEALINAVQQHPCIYDKSSKAYRNKFSKEKAWDAVANAVGKPVKQCQTRWKSLRDRFVKEELKLASGSEAPEYMDWKFSASMSFLRDHLQPRPTTSNFDSYQGEEYLTEDFESSYETSFEVLPQATPETSPTDLPKNKKRKTDEAHEKFCEVMGNLNSAVKVSMEGELTNNGFYKYIDSMLKTMDDKSRRLIEVEIINLVAERVNILYI
ncbi:uncharacterized protein [Musca autumnalis]|uniref:uncharacterized protein n=1 Tax=Musca autumnalis TaxID=221902 RepID=UPI003CFB27CB